MIVNTNIKAMNANNMLKKVDSNREKVMKKLSSGYKLNSAADDAAGIAISQKMQAQIRGLNRAARNIEDGKNLFNTGDGALQKVNDIINRAKELSVQAASDTNSDFDRKCLDEELQQLLSEIDDISETTVYNHIAVLKGYENMKSIMGDFIEYEKGQVQIFNALKGDFAMGSPQIQNALKSVNENGHTNTQFKAGSQTITFDLGAKILQADPGFFSNINSDGTINDMDRFINGLISGLNLGFSAGNPKETVVGGITPDGTLALGFISGVTFSAGSCSPANINAAIGHGFLHSMFKPSSESLDVEVDAQIPKTVKRIIGHEYTFPENQIWLQTGANAGDGLLCKWKTLGLRQTGLHGARLDPREEAVKTLGKIDNALKYVLNIRSDFGAFVNRLDAKLSNVTTAEINLTEAESRIADADIAKEMTELAKQNIISDAAMAMLANANSDSGNVLKLLAP